MMGFTREEVVQMIEYYRENGKTLHPTGELLEIMSRMVHHEEVK